MDMAKTFGSPRSLYTMIAKTIGGSMMRIFSWVLLLAFWAGCQDQSKVQEPSTVEQKSEPVAAQLSEEEVVVGSAEELKTVSPKNIT